MQQWQTNRVTTGRRVRCDQEYCPNHGKTWVLEPVKYRERGRLTSELHIWPAVLCDGCGCEPSFIGYVEELRTPS
jgi:hypothetical protein